MKLSLRITHVVGNAGTQGGFRKLQRLFNAARMPLCRLSEGVCQTVGAATVGIGQSLVPMMIGAASSRQSE